MTTQAHPDSQGGLTHVMWALALLGVAASAGGFAWFGWRVGVSVGIGALLGAGNLWVLARVVRGLLDPEAPSRPVALLALIKFTALFGGVYLLLHLGVVSVPSLAVGYGALPLGIVLGQFRSPPARAKEGS